jgi:hypothetical protein
MDQLPRVEAGNGATHFFITLSCAEYMWKDVRRLIIDRFEAAGLPVSDLEKSWVKIVNDCTLIVQEYFQERVKVWLKTVGKRIFKIKHYWLRFAFAPSRGQIHAHFIAITDFNEVFYRYSQLGPHTEAQAEFLKLWSEESLRIICDVGEDFASNSIKLKINSNTKKELGEKHSARKVFLKWKMNRKIKISVLCSCSSMSAVLSPYERESERKYSTSLNYTYQTYFPNGMSNILSVIISNMFLQSNVT